MYLFKVQLANQIIEIDSLHSRIKALSRDFIVEGEPTIHICITQEDINIQKRRYLENFANAFELREGFVEVSAVLQKVSEELINYNTILFHGAAISLNSEAFIFSGKSGMGKSTHICHWLENRPDTIVVNGDKPFIVAGATPLVCGSPWAGKENVYTNSVIPLKAIVMLERSDINYIEQISFAEAFPDLLQQTLFFNDPDKDRKVLNALKNLGELVSFYRFHVNNFKEDAFQVAYDALVGKKHC